MKKQDMYEQKTPDFVRFRLKVDNQRAFQKDWKEFLVFRSNTKYCMPVQKSINTVAKPQNTSNKKRKHKEEKEEKP